MMRYDKDYFDRLLRRGKYAKGFTMNLKELPDNELQQVIRASKQGERVAPTVDDADELIELSEQAKDVLTARHPLQNAGQEGLVK